MDQQRRYSMELQQMTDYGWLQIHLSSATIESGYVRVEFVLVVTSCVNAKVVAERTLLECLIAPAAPCMAVPLILVRERVAAASATLHQPRFVNG